MQGSAPQPTAHASSLTCCNCMSHAHSMGPCTMPTAARATGELSPAGLQGARWASQRRRDGRAQQRRPLGARALRVLRRHGPGVARAARRGAPHHARAAPRDAAVRRRRAQPAARAARQHARHPERAGSRRAAPRLGAPPPLSTHATRMPQPPHMHVHIRTLMLLTSSG